MRIDRLRILNYKGLEIVQLDSLADEPVVTISGRNGTGKSLLLEAIVRAWQDGFNYPSMVGPWGSEMEIQLEVRLAEHEIEAVERWVDQFPIPYSDELSSTALRIRASLGGWNVECGRLMAVLRDHNFRRQHPFASIDYLPARRSMGSARGAGFDLNLLEVDAQQRGYEQLLRQHFEDRTAITLPGVEQFLLALDYQALLVSRDGGGDANSEFEQIRGIFNRASGKQLVLPSLRSGFGAVVDVKIPAGHRHSVKDLSSGEQGMFAMLYFMSRVAASGGILCIDEPEQHLHPTLQAALFESMRVVAGGSQALVVTHSAGIVAVAGAALIEVKAPGGRGENQASRGLGESERGSLLGDLGITPSVLFRHDFLIVVEGETDASALRTVFPIEMGRGLVLVAGGSGQVLSAHRTLMGLDGLPPWLCVIDRDLRSEDDVVSLRSEYNNLFIWPGRELESVLLESPLISGLMNSLGVEWTVGHVDALLQEFASPLKDEVLKHRVEVALNSQFPSPTGRFALDRLAARYAEYSKVYALRAENLEDVVAAVRLDFEEVSESDWIRLVDPKVILSRLARAAEVFKKDSGLHLALLARARDVESERPAGIDAIGAALAKLLASEESAG